MILIEWQPGFSVGVKLIDEQHQLLVNMINDLYAAMHTGEERVVLQKMINRLAVYAAVHFAREEHYFNLFAYPHSEAHIRAHDDLEDQVYQFEEDFKAGRQELSMEVMSFLSDWLVEHITKSDRQFGPFLNARGIS